MSSPSTNLSRQQLSQEPDFTFYVLIHALTHPTFRDTYSISLIKKLGHRAEKEVSILTEIPALPLVPQRPWAFTVSIGESPDLLLRK